MIFDDPQETHHRLRQLCSRVNMLFRNLAKAALKIEEADKKLVACRTIEIPVAVSLLLLSNLCRS
jgi:hypothetical protein